MTTSNAAIDKTTAKTGTEKVHEKLAEKRRALGRGLESLLPGPRVVPAVPVARRLPPFRKVRGRMGHPQQFPHPHSHHARICGGHTSTDGAPSDALALPVIVDELQASAAGQTPER